jgi:hypothetical protein
LHFLSTAGSSYYRDYLAETADGEQGRPADWHEQFNY